MDKFIAHVNATSNESQENDKAREWLGPRKCGEFAGISLILTVSNKYNGGGVFRTLSNIYDGFFCENS